MCGFGEEIKHTRAGCVYISTVAVAAGMLLDPSDFRPIRVQDKCDVIV